MTHSIETLAPAAEIEFEITGPEGVVHHRLAAGDALVIGSSPACGLHFVGPGIAGLHCTLSWENGVVTVEDWDTALGTTIDGERIARAKQLMPQSVVRIGEYQLRIANTGDEQSPTEVDVADIQSESAPTPTAVTPTVESSEPTSKRASLAQDVWDSVFDDPTATDETTPSPAAYAPVDAFQDSPHSFEIEVELLRAQLADRDMRLAEMEQLSWSAQEAPQEDLPTREEVETLVDRLEDLLAELDQNDERIKTLTEMLRAAEDASAATEEERSQMESWIGEVERRVLHWEEEWHAERDRMQKTISELTQERDRAESADATAEQVQVLKTVRQQAAELQEQLQLVQQERDSLKARVESNESQSIEQQVQQAVEAAVREERLELSQAKAAFARERAAMLRQQEEMTVQQNFVQTDDTADLKIRAFRQHLKEIRQTEPSRPAPSLSNRLGKLWRKIEGKPLDTD